jgi:hypothetical protein
MLYAIDTLTSSRPMTRKKKHTRWVFLMAPKERQPAPWPHSDLYLAWDGTTTHDPRHTANFLTHAELVQFAESKGVTETATRYPYERDFDERDLRRAP